MTADSLVHHGVRSSTREVYNSAQRQYRGFCDIYGLPPIPASENNILLFIAWMYTKGRKASTIRVYLAAIRMLHITGGSTYRLENNPRIQLAVRAVEIGDSPPVQKLPITLQIMSKLYSFVKTELNNYNELLVWSAMCLAHFGCFRSGEIAANGQFDPSRHLSRNSILFEHSHLKPYVVVHLKQSKTDHKNAGIDIVVTCTGQDICAYCSLSTFCFLRDSCFPKTSALFIFQNGQILTKIYLYQRRNN